MESVSKFSFCLELFASRFFSICSTENRTTVSKMRVISEYVRVINEPFYLVNKRVAIKMRVISECVL